MSDIGNATNNVQQVGLHNRFEINIDSVELAFAQLQNELAETNRNNASEKIKVIKEQQAEQKKVSELIVQLRNLTTDKKDDAKVDVPASLSSALKAYGVTLDSGEKTVASVNAAIQSMQNVQETIGSDIQQEMLIIQDYMSKVSSYSQGAIGAINKAGDTLTSIVR